MTSAELTALHTETLTEIAEERTLKNIARRAESLFTEQGYTYEVFSDDFFHVFSPQGAHYTVICGAVNGFSCTCPCFTSRNTCKHLLAVDGVIKENLRLEAMFANKLDAENADFGCDPYARF